MSNEMPKDIVAELRIHSAVIDQLAGNIFERSADEIERLRRDYSCICREMRRMMEERDEARREILESLHPDRRESYAAARGWEYENTDDR